MWAMSDIREFQFCRINAAPNRYNFNNALAIQHHNMSIAIVLTFLRMAYVNLIATVIVFNIRASSCHIGLPMAFSEHRRWIISVFDRRSIMNRLYWQNQQVGYLCFNLYGKKGVSLPLWPISDRDHFTLFAHVLSHSGMVMRACGRSLGAKDRSR